MDAHGRITRISQNLSTDMTTVEFGDGMVAQVPMEWILELRVLGNHLTASPEERTGQVDRVVPFRHKGWGAFAFDA